MLLIATNTLHVLSIPVLAIADLKKNIIYCSFNLMIEITKQKKINKYIEFSFSFIIEIIKFKVFYILTRIYVNISTNLNEIP